MIMVSENKDRKVRYDLDLSSRESLERSARDLILGETVHDVAFMCQDKEEAESLLKNIRNKGNIGGLVERVFGIAANCDQYPDFKELKVELKATPVEKGTKYPWKAGERLVITKISYKKKDNEIDGRKKYIEETHLAEKIGCILLCVYERPKKHKGVDPGTYKFKKVVLFTPPEKDLPVIKRDWEIIMSYVYSGQADKLSESLTEYLGACPKAANSKALSLQEYSETHSYAKPRAFCFKNSYMTYLQNNYIMQDRDIYIRQESLGSDFEKEALSRLKRYSGRLASDIAKELGFNLNISAKQRYSNLSFAMIGLSSNSCEEFTKANIVMKAIRFEESGVLKESISLPPEDFLSVLNENTFEDSALYEYFEETRFLLSIWRKEIVEGKEDCRFIGAAFWGMSGLDIFGPLQDCWEETKYKLTHGVTLTPGYKGNKIVVENDLPKMSKKGSIAHVRPHASKSYHVINGKVYSNSGDKKDIKNAFVLSNGNMMTIQSFWLNHGYVIDVVKSLGIDI